jgi:dienelactone hydrolase
MRSNSLALLLQLLLCFCLIFAEFGCGKSSPVVVTITPTSATAGAGQSLPFSAMTSNGSQITWSASCSNQPCGSFSPSVTPSGGTTNYGAPSTEQANSEAITITAAASSSASAQATVTLSPYQASVSSDASQVNPGAAAHLTAQASSGPANAMFTWTLSCSPTPCGSVSPTTTQTGAATTYTAPDSLPLAGLTVTFTATSTANSSISASGTIQVLGVQVTVAPSTANVEGTSTQPFTATVTNDPTNSGVTWSISCGTAPCGSIPAGPTASATSNPYTAPAPPAADLAVTITATSVAYSGATATASVTVPAITVSVSPASALIPLNSSLPFTATVANDPANAGVNWTLNQASSACSSCGSVSPTATSSGNPTTYSPPAKMPATPTVTLTATSAADNTKSASATANLSTGSVQLVPQGVDFGDRIVSHTGSAKPVTLTNAGTTALNITGISFSGTDPNDFSQTNTCGSSVGSGASCTINFTFVPAQRGVRSATALIADSSTDSPQQISLSGTGFTQNGSEENAVRSTVAGSMIAAAPLPTGPEPVGTRTFDWIDSSRPDPFLSHGVSRELLVRFWYPASLTETCEAAEYTAPGVWSFFSHLLGVPLPRITTNSCLNAPVAGGVHPIVVFTHGYTGTFTDYTYLFEDLASQGYIVASVNHTSEATATEFPDGRFVKSALGSYIDNTWRADEKTLAFASAIRLQDLEFVLNQLAGLNRGAGNPFAHRLDLSRVAIAGHSAGGTIAFRVLGQDPRFKAGVILDGYFSPTDIHPTLAPVLILRAGSETSAEDRCLLATRLRGPYLLVNLSGAEHLTPTDALWIARGAIASGPMGPEGTIGAIRNYVSSFLDTNLREKAVHPLMSGTFANHPDAGLSQGSQSCIKP